MGKKTFDCVEMQHRGGAAIYATISKMTRQEQIAYWQEGTKRLRERQRALRTERGPGTTCFPPVAERSAGVPAHHGTG